MSILLESKAVVARKPHRCFWCGEVISVGETYIREKYVIDGEIIEYCVHKDCDEFFSKVVVKNLSRFLDDECGREDFLEQLDFWKNTFNINTNTPACHADIQPILERVMSWTIDKSKTCDGCVFKKEKCGKPFCVALESWQGVHGMNFCKPHEIVNGGIRCRKYSEEGKETDGYSKRLNNE